MDMIEITGRQGQLKQVELLHFSALDGWDIQMRFLDFAATTDKAFRRAFVMEILQYARVVVGDHVYPLATDGLIDNHLETWTNIQAVFEAVLLHNGIDPVTHASKPHFWANAGSELAVAFIAECTKLMGPAFELAGQAATQEG
jgi:hypothetical protein